MTPCYDKQAEENKVSENYRILAAYTEKYKKLSYMQLDYALVHEIPLFTIEPDFDFNVLERKIDEILAALPSIKRIFAQPFIHLKEQDVILPIEAVRIIDNNTIKHASSHSELWTDIKESEIKPSKLLTRTYEDNYGIYENLVFCKTVDDVLSFARTNLRFLKELIYTNRTIEINLLERLNHLSYFLALGKLHTGYVRNFDAYYGISKRCLNKLQYITNTVIPRLKRPVYKNNRVRPAQIRLRKTNILSMHKEYHRVYKLAKFFADNNAAGECEAPLNESELQKIYYYFCELLCVFSVGHFNFECDENKPIDFSKLNVDFVFKGWKLKLRKVKCKDEPLIEIKIKKEKEYNVILIPSVKEENGEFLSTVKEQIAANEYALCTPFEESCEKRTLLDITSLESFRRIQQIVLRGMVYADGKRDECPFCKNKLTISDESTENGTVYECPSCRTQIGEKFCIETGKTFPYIKISNYSKPVSAAQEEEWLKQRKEEAQMYFRNITELNEDMEIICPHCGKVHK